MKKTFTKLTTLFIALTLSTSLMAAEQIVINNNDDGAGSLRQAIADVGVGEGITFDADYTITLSSELTINQSMTITGTGATIIQANANPSTATYRVFNITSGTVTLEDMTLRHGKVVGNGGGIYITGGTVNLNSITIKDSEASLNGGAICVINPSSSVILNCSQCSFTGNSANHGGAIFFLGTDELSITKTTVSNNTAISRGGGCIWDLPIQLLLTVLSPIIVLVLMVEPFLTQLVIQISSIRQ